MLENYFNYKKHKTDFKTEVVAGTTTFLTMAYIMFLNLLVETNLFIIGFFYYFKWSYSKLLSFFILIHSQ